MRSETLGNSRMRAMGYIFLWLNLKGSNSSYDLGIEKFLVTLDIIFHKLRIMFGKKKQIMSGILYG